MSGETEVEEIMGTVTDVYNPGLCLRHLRHSGRGSGCHQGDGWDSGVWPGHPVQCSLVRKRKEESKAVKNLKMRVKYLESQNALLK